MVRDIGVGGIGVGGIGVGSIGLVPGGRFRRKIDSEVETHRPEDHHCEDGSRGREGFDAGPFLITLHQTVKAESCEKVEGKLVLRDLPGTPVADLPVLQQESARLMMISTDYYHVLEDVEIDAKEYAKHVTVQYR